MRRRLLIVLLSALVCSSLGTTTNAPTDPPNVNPVSDEPSDPIETDPKEETLCITCLDKGKTYYSEFLPEFAKAKKEALANPTSENCDRLFKIHKRLLIGAAILQSSNSAYKKQAIGKVLKSENNVLARLIELDTFYYDHIFGHVPNQLKTKTVLQKFYAKVSETEDNGGYLDALLKILATKYPIKSSASLATVPVTTFIISMTALVLSLNV